MTDQEKTSPQSTIIPGNLGTLVDVSEVHLNVKQALIITTEDRVRIHLSSHLSKVEKRKAWIAPLGILLTIITTLITSKFKDANIIFSASTWEAIFVIAGIFSLVWLLYAIRQACKSESIDDLINRLKRESK
jgi:hypothetical protein